MTWTAHITLSPRPGGRLRASQADRPPARPTPLTATV
jgi:hypothetical protein